MTPKVPVTFLPSGTTAWVEPGTTLLEAGRSAGVMIAAPCGGRGICGSCGVRVLEGEIRPPDSEEKQGLGRAPSGVRLACRARVSGAATVRPVVSSVRPTSTGASGAARVVLGIDLGTTNVACVAVESDGGREVGRAFTGNRQASWGADVLSRLSAALSGHNDGVRVAAEDSVIEAAVAAAGGAEVERAVLAGNTAMSALIAGVDASGLAVSPFIAPSIPTHLQGRVPAALGGAEVRMVPPLVSFVGGDAVAGVVHTGMLYADAPVLLVDLGTNAEIVLAHRGRLFAASAAAGPAFEGAGIECGGPAAEGAITAVRVDADGAFVLETLGSSEPRWLSGAGLLSMVSLLVQRGHLLPDGAFKTTGPFEERFTTREDGILRFAIADGVALSQLDVRSVQLAKAAVAVGVQKVLSAARVPARKLQHLFVAGAFGAAVDADDLVTIGIVPRSSREAVQSVGNAALTGAAAIALAPDLLDSLRPGLLDVQHVDLASSKGFNEALMNALALQPFDA